MTSIFQQLNKYDPHFVGFDRLFNRLNAFDLNPTSGGNYPPYNIIRDGDNYTIELAVAGFNDDEIEVVHEPEHNRLLIEGSNENTEQEYVHRGIASRKFRRSWTIANHIIVKNAKLSDGILRIELENVVPEEQRPKEIEIEVS